jgi:hypothetical protein
MNITVRNVSTAVVEKIKSVAGKRGVSQQALVLDLIHSHFGGEPTITGYIVVAVAGQYLLESETCPHCGEINASGDWYYAVTTRGMLHLMCFSCVNRKGWE